MTSEERKEARFQRRKAARAEKKAACCGQSDNFDWVFSYEHLYHSYKMCRRNVGWKASVQKYITNAPHQCVPDLATVASGKVPHQRLLRV